MRVLILAGGKGTRLLPLTKYMPKPMVSVHGKPFIYYILKWLKKHDVVLSIGYQRNSIRNWCKENKIVVEFIDEMAPLGTGGALRIAEPFFKTNKKFAVINGDTYIDEDITQIGKHHKGLATIVKARSMLDKKMKPAGVYIFSNKIFKYMERPYEFNLDERLKCVDCNEYTSDREFLDVGSHQGLKFAKEQKVFKGKRWESI